MITVTTSRSDGPRACVSDRKRSRGRGEGGKKMRREILHAYTVILQKTRQSMTWHDIHLDCNFLRGITRRVELVSRLHNKIDLRQ